MRLQVHSSGDGQIAGRPASCRAPTDASIASRADPCRRHRAPEHDVRGPGRRCLAGSPRALVVDWRRRPSGSPGPAPRACRRTSLAMAAASRPLQTTPCARAGRAFGQSSNSPSPVERYRPPSALRERSPSSSDVSTVTPRIATPFARPFNGGVDHLARRPMRAPSAAAPERGRAPRCAAHRVRNVVELEIEKDVARQRRARA